MTTGKGLYQFLYLSWNEKILFFEALFFLYVTKFLLLFYSFNQIATFSFSKKCRNYIAYDKIPELIKTAVARANRLTFWRNECLVKSLAARWMLDRRKIQSQISLGVIFDKNNKLKAHAWIQANNIEIVNKNLNYKELIVIH